MVDGELRPGNKVLPGEVLTQEEWEQLLARERKALGRSIQNSLDRIFMEILIFGKPLDRNDGTDE